MTKNKKINFYTLNALGVTGVICFLLLFVIFPRTSLAECWFYRYTGWYCPACGGTRAVLALMKGQLFHSFCYHPLVLYSLVCYLFILGQAWKHFILKTPYRHPKIAIWCVRIGLVLLIINWMVQNIVHVILHC